ncbi:MAG: hypothetical protein QW393_04680 [Candidatus Micrarchaeaceae archaeon]
MVEKKVRVRQYEKNDGTHVRGYTRKQDVKANFVQEIPEEEEVNEEEKEKK